MQILQTILLVTLLVNLAYGADNAISLNVGQPAPYSGILLTPAAAADQRTVGQQRDSYKLLNGSLQTSLDAANKEASDAKKEVKLLQTDNQNLASNLRSTQRLSDWEKVGYFVLGIVVTSLAIDGASKLSH